MVFRPSTRRRVPARLAALAALVAITAVAWSWAVSNSKADPSESIASPSVDPSAQPAFPGEAGAPDATTVPEVTSTTLPKTVLSETLELNATGPEVRMVQQRLNDLKFDVGKVDGLYGDNTRAAVWAYQALISASKSQQQADGRVTPELWSRMQEPLGLGDWRPNAGERHALISLPQQVMVVWNKGQIEVITHVSSGSGQEWCAQPKDVPPWPGATTTTNVVGRLQKKCGKSVTPGGVYQIYMKVKGKAEIPLGTVYDPLYFNQGIAIHGFDQVPSMPASHGCVRVPLHIGTRLFEVLRRGDAVYVWDGVKEPEFYGRQTPPGDFLDPNDKEFIDATSTTTSTTSTTEPPSSTTSPTSTATSTSSPPRTSTSVVPSTTATVATTAAPSSTSAPPPTVATTQPLTSTTKP